jgi:hypothetical protein
LSEELEEYVIINEIDINNQSFKTCLEIDCFNCIITNNRENELIIYDFKKGNKLLEIQYKEKDDFTREVLFMDKISEKKIIVKISGNNPMRNLEESIILNINNSTIENSIFNSVENTCCHWEIFEFEKKDNNIKIKKNHIFNKDISYLEAINNKFLLLYDKKENKIILFDLLEYFEIIQIPFKYQKPIISYTLRRRTELLDLLCISEGQYLMQCTLNLELGSFYAVARIKLDKSLFKRRITLENKRDSNANERENLAIMNDMSIAKTVTLSKNNFLIFTKDNSIYNLKYMNK